MTSRVALFAALLCSATPCFSQFEVASIKPAVPGSRARMEGGPGTSDPGRIKYNLSLRYLIMAAYHVGSFQLSGPSWMDDKTFEVVAKLPPGTTGPQLQEMLRRLLADRFHLALAREQKIMAGYALTVAKDGPKLKASGNPNSDTADDFDPLPSGPPNQLELDREGYPIVPPGEGQWLVALRSGRARTHQLNTSMHDLAVLLSNQLGKPVVDETGLKGRFEFTLSWTEGVSAQATEFGPDLATAVQQQLGLKLEASRRPVDVLVVERLEKEPTEN